jgi:membrane protein DedA with SNARE-associated domain
LSELAISLTNYSEQFIYVGLFLILFLCGLGLPIPEEITLLTAGFLVQLGFTRFYPTLMVIFPGVIIGDLALYSIGRKWGEGILTHRHLHQIFSERRLDKARRFFRNHGNKTIFVARFISGFRVAAFLAAGTMGMKARQFILLDFLAALIQVPRLISLGFFFGGNIAWLAEVFTRLDFLIKMGAVLGGVAGFGYYLWRRKKSALRGPRS